MGLDDRDYMRDVPVYKELVGRGSSLPPLSPTATTPGRLPAPGRTEGSRRGTPGGTHPWAWFLLGAIAMVAVLAYLLPMRPTQPAQPATPPPATPAMPAPTYHVVAAPT